MKLFCKHEWKILSEKREQSSLEKILNAKVGVDNIKLVNGKLIQILTCNKCGDLREFVEEIA